MPIRTRCAALILLAPVVLALVVACGSEPTVPSPQPTQTAAPSPEATPASSELQTALASSDLSVGLTRVAFGLIDRQSGPLRGASVQVSTFYLGGGQEWGPIETVEAIFRKWPVGPGGVYTAQLSFDRPGDWGLGMVVSEADGSTRTSSVGIEVRETSATPALGSSVPRTVSKTARDVTELEELTTDAEPDPDLYAMTISEAIGTGKPLMVTFATPAYCQTSRCGPQLDVVKELKERYGGRVSFIHIEIYDNPLEIQGDLSRAFVSPTVTEWNLPSEPWTFIVTREGILRAKFEGFTTSEELEDALAGVLD